MIIVGWGLLFLLWFLVGKLLLAYAQSRNSRCLRDWCNQWAVMFWPLFFCWLIADRYSRHLDKEKITRRLRSTQRDKALEELNSSNPFSTPGFD